MLTLIGPQSVGNFCSQLKFTQNVYLRALYLPQKSWAFVNISREIREE